MPACAPLNSIVRTHKSTRRGRGVDPSLSRRRIFIAATSTHRPAHGVGSIGRPSPRDQSQFRESSRRLVIDVPVLPAEMPHPPVKVSGVAPLGRRRHPALLLRKAPFVPVSQKKGLRQKGLRQGTQSASETTDMCVLTTRWSGRGMDKVPSSNAGVRAAQLNR